MASTVPATQAVAGNVRHKFNSPVCTSAFKTKMMFVSACEWKFECVCVEKCLPVRDCTSNAFPHVQSQSRCRYGEVKSKFKSGKKNAFRCKFCKSLFQCPFLFTLSTPFPLFTLAAKVSLPQVWPCIPAI